MFLFDGAQKRETLSKVKAACFVMCFATPL